MQPGRIADLLSPFLGGASLTDSQISQLAVHLDLLLRWNARINLTAVRDPEQIVTRHFGESLFAARHLFPSGWQLTTGNRQLIDIGSGAGFPGLPIKIWTSALSVTLLESNQRKATFLRELVRALQLTGIQVVSDRAENFAAEIAKYKLQITNLTVTLRAVERFHQVLPTAVELLQHFPAANCRLALLIGASQVETARALAGSLTWSDPLPSPQSSQRVLLVGHLA